MVDAGVVSDLAGNLDEAVRLVATTLTSARAELVELDRRRVDLVDLIARTEAMYDALTPGSAPRPMDRCNRPSACALPGGAALSMVTPSRDPVAPVPLKSARYKLCGAQSSRP